HNKKVPPTKRLYNLHVLVGKTGERHGIGTHGVQIALNYLKQIHPNPKPEDTLFHVKSFKGSMKRLLVAAKLRKDSHAKLRSMKTLRHPSIMVRFLLEPGISAFELATISGNSVSTLENYYLRHLTGLRVSDRLMDKALAELGVKPKPKVSRSWVSPEDMRER